MNPNGSRLRGVVRAVLYNVGPIVVCLLLWEASVRSGLISAFFLPPVSVVLATLWEILVSGELMEHFSVTIWRMVAGFTLGSGSAIVFGLVVGLSKPLRQFFWPIVAAVYPLPKIALLSLFLVVFGIGDPPIIASVTVSAFFPVLLNTLIGLRTVDEILIKAARDLGANQYQVITKVVLPAALPLIFTGLRQSSAVSLIVVVAVEMYIGENGAGYVLTWSTEFFKINILYAYTVAIAIFGIILFNFVDILEKYLLPWAKEK